MEISPDISPLLQSRSFSRKIANSFQEIIDFRNRNSLNLFCCCCYSHPSALPEGRDPASNIMDNRGDIVLGLSHLLMDFPENHPDTLFLGKIRAHRMYVRPERKSTFPRSNTVTYVEMTIYS